VGLSVIPQVTADVQPIQVEVQKAFINKLAKTQAPGVSPPKDLFIVWFKNRDGVSEQHLVSASAYAPGAVALKTMGPGLAVAVEPSSAPPVAPLTFEPGPAPVPAAEAGGGQVLFKVTPRAGSAMYEAYVSKDDLMEGLSASIGLSSHDMKEMHGLVEVTIEPVPSHEPERASVERSDQVSPESTSHGLDGHDLIELVSTLVTVIELLGKAPKVARKLASRISSLLAIVKPTTATPTPSILGELASVEMMSMRKLVTELSAYENDPRFDEIEKDKHRKRIAARGCALLKAAAALKDQIAGYEEMRAYFCNEVPEALAD